MFDFSDTVVLVTGATGGIGRAICQAFGATGASVVASDLADQAQVDGAAIYQKLDVASEANWLQVVNDIEKQQARLDVLVNCAGICKPVLLTETSLETWRQVQAINVEGTFLGMKTAANLMRQTGGRRMGGSSIVNISSVAGLKGVPFIATYCASKGAIRLLSKSAAAEFIALGWPIRVNSVHPSAVETPMIADIQCEMIKNGFFPDKETAAKAMTASLPGGRRGTPKEIAASVIYLSSMEAGFVNGTELVIDGGVTASR